MVKADEAKKETPVSTPDLRFSQWLTSAVLDYQCRSRVWFTSESLAAEHLRVAPSTFIAWRKGISIPRREQCIKVAQRLGAPTKQALEAAGHPPMSDTSPVTYQELLEYAEAADTAIWPPEQKWRIVAALRETASDDFANNPLRPATDIRLRQLKPLAERAESIAKIMDLWLNRG